MIRALLYLLALLTACARQLPPPDPTVRLSATETEGAAPLVVRFSAEATPQASRYTWTLGGETRTTSVGSLAHTFHAPGLYVVSVRATSRLGTATDSLTVNVTGSTQPKPPDVPENPDIRVTRTPGGPAPWAVRYRAEVVGFDGPVRVRAGCSERDGVGAEGEAAVTCIHLETDERVTLELFTEDGRLIGRADVLSGVAAPEEGVAFLGTWRYTARGVTKTFEIVQGTRTAGESAEGAFKLFVIKERGVNVAEFTLADGRTVVLTPVPGEDGRQVFVGEVYGLRLERLGEPR